MFKPLCPYDVIIIAVGYITLQVLFQLLKLEHFPSTNFYPCNLKHKSSAGLIDRFKSCVSSFNSACVVIWVSYELGSTCLYHSSYFRHPVLCHLDHPPGSMTGVKVHTTSYCVALVSKLMANLCVQ